MGGFSLRSMRLGAFTALPPTYWFGLLLILTSYAVLAHLAKMWFARRFGLD